MKITTDEVAAMIYARQIEINRDGNAPNENDFEAAKEVCKPLALHSLVAAQIFIDTLNEVKNKQNEDN